MTAGAPSVVARSTQLLRFATKYRHLVGSVAPRRDADADATAFARDIQKLGPAFIKIGQALSVRPDLLPPRYLAALERLQDDVDPIAFDAIRGAVEGELRVRLSKAYARFERMPLAAASIAQVHAASLRDGRRVVVKVQRPGIRRQILSDLAVLGSFARAADRFTDHGRRVHFAEWIDEIAQTLDEELDYRLEAANLALFRTHLERYPTLLVPAPIDDLSARHVLTMEYVEGMKITQAIALRRLEHPLAQLAADLVAAYLDQVFEHRLVHADPHPGNLILAGDRLALIDLGMVIRLAPRARDDLLRLLGAIVDGDSDRVADRIAAMGETLALFDERAWRRRCGRLVLRYRTHDDRTRLGAGGLMLELARQSVASGLRPPPEIAVLGRTLFALEGAVRLLAPSLSTRQIVGERLGVLVLRRAAHEASPANVRAHLVDLAELGSEFPRQARAILDLVAHNRLRVRISGLEESRLLENLQKIANRISAGLVAAALVIGAALTLRVDAGPRLFGYPGLALVMFVLAFALGAALVIGALASDRRASRYRARR